MSPNLQSIFEYANGTFNSNGEKLYLSEKKADFHFIFESANGERERLPVHKLLLSASDVFEAMFNGKWKETAEATMEDTTAAAFKEFLQFFYFSRVKLTKEYVGAVMKLGHMYNVIHCVNACAQFMMNIMTDENVCWVYKYALTYSCEELKKYCEAVIGIYTKRVIKSESFLNCNREILNEIVKMDSLHCSEVELFDACMAWVKAAAQQDQLTVLIVKAYLGKSFHEIRFGLIKLQEFAAIDSKNDIFAIAEHKEIIQMIACEEYEPNIFSENRKKRFQQIQLNAGEVVADRVIATELSDKPYFVKDIETTVISTNKPIMLTGLQCEDLSSRSNHGYSHLKEDVESAVTIVEVHDSMQRDEGVIVYDGSIKLKSESSTNIIPSDPILMRPGWSYEIRMKQSPPKECCTRFNLNSEMKFESGVIINFRNLNDKEEEIVARGLIYSLRFIPL